MKWRLRWNEWLTAVASALIIIVIIYGLYLAISLALSEPLLRDRM
jgi:hypothetical protein